MNGSSNVLVLGVTGQVGKRVATNLKRKKATLSVGSRRKANLKELADQYGASRFIDLDDPRTFDEALNNVTSIFLITGYTVDMLVQSKSLIDAAKRNGVTHIVHLGAFTREHDSYATVFAWHQMIEAYLRNSGVAWTNLHPNNGSWGYTRDDHNFKSTGELIRYLVRAAGANANLLLNVGPMPNGKIQPEAVQRLQEMGAWLAKYGDSIYGTRAGPISPRAWGVTTRKDNRIFIHILD